MLTNQHERLRRTDTNVQFQKQSRTPHPIDVSVAHIQPDVGPGDTIPMDEHARCPQTAVEMSFQPTATNVSSETCRPQRRGRGVGAQVARCRILSDARHVRIRQRHNRGRASRGACSCISMPCLCSIPSGSVYDDASAGLGEAPILAVGSPRERMTIMSRRGSAVDTQRARTSTSDPWEPTPTPGFESSHARLIPDVCLELTSPRRPPPLAHRGRPG